MVFDISLTEFLLFIGTPLFATTLVFYGSGLLIDRIK